MANWDEHLWWLTLLVGIAAAALSVVTSLLDRRQVEWPNRQQRFFMHLMSYGLLSISVALFILRGLIVNA